MLGTDRSLTCQPPQKLSCLSMAECREQHGCCAGLYADLDFEVLQPFDGLIKGESLVLAAMTDDLTFNHSIPNAWMASAPGHRFWQFCLQHIMSAASPCSLNGKKG